MKYAKEAANPPHKQTRKKDSPVWNSVKIAGIYLIAGCLWVLFSDRFVGETVMDISSATFISMVKGWLYVLLSSCLILSLVHSALKKQKSIQNKLNQSLTELTESENLRKTITEKMLNAYVLHKIITDETGKPCDFEYIDVNTAFENFTGFRKEDIIGKRYKDFVPEYISDTKDWVDISGQVVLTGEPVSFEGYAGAFGKWFAANAYIPLEGYFAVVFNDITEMKSREDELRDKNDKLAALYEALSVSEEELRQQYDELSGYQNQVRISDERYKLAIEGSNDIIWDLDMANDRFYVSDRSLELLGYDRSEYEKYGQQSSVWLNLMEPGDRDIFAKCAYDHIDGQTSFLSCEVRFLCKNFEYKWFHIRGKALKDHNGMALRFAGSMTDIDQRKRDELQLKKSNRELENANRKLHATQDELQSRYDELKEYQEKLHEFAYSDSLTNLPNRLALNENLSLWLKEFPTEKLALLFIDSDNFKLINDTMGHSFGDEFVIEVGKKLKSLLDSRQQVFRLGGDEFIIVYSGYTRQEQVEEFAGRILQSFVEPFCVGSSSLYSTVSIGISAYPRDGSDLDALMKNADIAMYKAKALGKNNYVLYDPKMNETVKKRMLIEKHLRGALSNQEFLLYYQPQVEIETGRITGFEALLRWFNPVLGFMSPLKFIGLAEETHLIIGIGEWVLREACVFLRQLHENGYPDLIMSVNISIIQLIQDNFTNTVFRILEDSGLPARYLELEITESVLMESFQVTSEKLIRLKKRGIKIALDDFGKGYSSLSYLRQLPIDTLKIDKTFIDSIHQENIGRSLTGTIMEIGRGMGLSVIAEGVEKPEQVEYLIQHKCHKIQGFLISEPVPSDEAEKLLANWNAGMFQAYA